MFPATTQTRVPLSRRGSLSPFLKIVAKASPSTSSAIIQNWQTAEDKNMNAVRQLCACFAKTSFMLETLCAMPIGEKMIREATINDVNSIAEIRFGKITEWKI
jgi:hypothetical protein